MNHFLIFGSHPRLSLAELKAVRPDLSSPTLCGAAAVVEDGGWNATDLMNRLGGTVKLGDIVQETTITDLNEQLLAELIQRTPRSNRVLFGLTVYGGSTNLQHRFGKLALPLKRLLTAEGRSVRWITSDEGNTLSPAAVSKMRLTDEGYDIVLLVDGTRVFIGLTTHVQNAYAWSNRDYGRPTRDKENGMLPPKLARMMVNLACVPNGGTLLDPFCGSGTVLMEAALATYAAKLIGTDAEAKQIADARRNTDWLVQERILRTDDAARFSYAVSDIKNIATHVSPNSIDCVVTEGYLGPTLRGGETEDILTRTSERITKLWHDTLTVLHPILKNHGRVVGIWPSFKTDRGVGRVDLTANLNRLGYRLINPLDGWDESNNPLLYHRPGQFVMRRIVVLDKR